jgi:transcriptional regulator with XRE-family HTH domain
MNMTDDILLPPAENFSKGARPRSRLAQWRILSGLRQEDLAKAIHLSTAWISGVEHGTILPSLQQRIVIARALNVPPEALFPEDEEERE